ncbi:calcium-translocating P-type ATPase [Colletotrichum asianum]|uniref:Calcium-transporting ATPase n=1 Tax=Colletotrichum asianum TaxID=702518 RepID=A0A8H3ZLK6_9PEZI|nr:calcium-translocating P-type ATPase [Colletotrichum asianum]
MTGNMLAPPAPHGPSRSRSASKTDTIISTTSNPFLTPTVTSCASSSHEDSEEALKPDPGTESDFKVDNNPFAFSPGQLNKLLNPKSLPAFRALGGLNGIAYGLQSDINTGLSVDETAAPGTVSFQDAVNRIRVYKCNVLPAKKATPLWKLMWNAYNDQVLILLTVAAVISLALGLYETLGVEHPPGSPIPVDWVEGVAICAAIAIVTLVGSINDWQKERAFVRLSAKKDEREVKVTRSGKQALISVYDVLVGDVLHLEPGDLVPVDGVYIDGHELRCDESSATGESDAIKKTGGSIVMRALENGESVTNLDPFIVSGAKVLKGVGTFMCTSVGVNSSFGKIMMSVRTETEPTPLQKKLEGLAMAIAKLGSATAGLLFFVLLFRFLAGLPNDSRPSTDKASSFMDILIVAVTIIVVAVPEGLPLAVTLALAFATTRMLKENNLVRVLRACETMGNATAICSDKTGTLTTNKMTVVAGRFDDTSFSASESLSTSSPSILTWASKTSPAFKEVLIQSVAINSTAFEGDEEGKSVFVGSKTETALLQLAKDHLGLQSLAEIRANEQVIQLMPFDSSKKCMGAVIRLRSGAYPLLVKGASEILLEYCSTKANFTTLDAEILTAMDRVSFTDTIDEYANRSLRTIALVYKDYQEWPPSSATNDATCCSNLGGLLQSKDLVFLGVVGIQDPVRPGVPEAVRKAQHAGVNARMVTGDNAVTAKTIASECGIYTDGIVMEGPDFRRLSDAEMDNMLPNLHVLARSSPEDKRILVSKLKALGETVAVTGDGTNDAPALKAADIGFSMGVSGTEVAKEASSIILMDDNFTSINTALKWGRAVNDAVRKFLQFQITVNITAVLLAFVTAVYDTEMKPVLTAVQLLWVNLIMDTFAALALATDPPTEKILDGPPQGKKKALITTNTWKMIIGQSIYQLIVTFVLYFGGGAILNYDLNDPDKKLELETIVFNTFAWMQIFNEFNNRRLDNKFNIFEGVHRNLSFIVINCIMVGLQLAIIFIGSRAFQISPGGLDGTQWGISIVVSALCLPWAILIHLFPDAWFAAIVELVGRPFLACYSCLSTGISFLAGASRIKREEDAEAGPPPLVVVSNDNGIKDQ